MKISSSNEENRALKNYYLLKESINKIINNNILDEEIIDCTVDKIVDLCKYMPNEAEQLFSTLINYYEKYNFEACVDYVSIFYNFFSQEKEDLLLNKSI